MWKDYRKCTKEEILKDQYEQLSTLGKKVMSIDYYVREMPMHHTLSENVLHCQDCEDYSKTRALILGELESLIHHLDKLKSRWERCQREIHSGELDEEDDYDDDKTPFEI